MTDYIGILDEIPASHSGPIVEQIHRASAVAVKVLRDFGLYLPGATKLPVQREVRAHLVQMANRAIGTYSDLRRQVPKSVGANEVWGEDSDELFTVVVSGLTVDDVDGFTAEIEMNLLYTGGQ